MLAELWPQCHPMLDLDAQPATLPHADGQNLAICQELDSLLAGLQSSWHAVQHQSQACSVLGVIPGILPCSSDSPQSMPTSSRPFNTNLPSTPKSAQQQQQQQLGARDQRLQPGPVMADSTSNSNKSPSGKGQHLPRAARAETHSTVQVQHSEHTLFPGPILTPSTGQQHQQQQHQTGHDWVAHQQLAEQQTAQSNERLKLSQDTAQGTAQGHWLWGGAVLSAQNLLKTLIYDTQVVGFSFLCLHSVASCRNSCRVHFPDWEWHIPGHICLVNTKCPDKQPRLDVTQCVIVLFGLELDAR